MPLVFDPGESQITSDWLKENADRIDEHINEHGDHSVAVFEVEQADDGYLHLRVSMRYDMREAASFEIETGWMTAEGMQADRAGIGLYTKLNDLKAMLEILARGNHF